MRARVRKIKSVDVAAELRQMGRNLTELDPLLMAIGEIVDRLLRESFDAAQNPLGDAWLALNPITLRIKLKRGEGSAPLVRTGMLRNGLTVSLDSPTTVSIGWTGDLAELAALHQSGTRHMPARTLIGDVMPPDVSAEIERAIRAHIVRLTSKATTV